MSYYCERCGRVHKEGSKIGVHHKPYRSLPEEESKVNPNEIRLDPQLAQLNSPRAEPPLSGTSPESLMEDKQNGGGEPETVRPEETTAQATAALSKPVSAPPQQAEAEAQLKLLAEALGIQKLSDTIKAQQAQINQLTRGQGEILAGAAPTSSMDLTKYGITPETIQQGVKWVVQEVFKGGGDEDEQLARAIIAEQKARRALVIKDRVKLIYDAIDTGLPLYAGEAPPGPLTPKKEPDKK